MSTGENRTINTGGGNYNERINCNYIQGNYYAAGQPQSLAEAATEIQKLLEQLEKSYSPETTAGKMAMPALGYAIALWEKLCDLLTFGVANALD